MKLFSTFSAILLGCSAVLARPFPEHTLEERQNGITYLRQKTNIASRYEIRQLRDQYPNQYTLFVLALQRMQQKPKSDPVSYFALASIHGVPRDNYNNVGQCGGGGCANTDGYAVHDSVLFPTWHRAYIGLFEQELCAVARQIATEYPQAQKATMQKAANALRLPYYDAAAKPKPGSPAFPNLMTDVYISVNGPKGPIPRMLNPLFRFDIPDPSGFVYQYFTTWTKTLRYPSSNAGNAQSQTSKAKDAITNIRQSWADQFYGLFTNCHAWLQFSNDRAGSSAPGCATSMEDVHNGIHTAIGGANDGSLSGGHMYYLPISSFDPTFWLHHANIDRITAMWQTLNPNAWGNSQSTPTASWTIPVGQVVGPQSPLTPFRREQGGNGGFWTSDGVRNWRNLGYTYPEYTNGHGSAADITTYVNELYGPNAGTAAGGINKRDLLDDIANTIGQTVQDTVGAAVSDPSGNPIGDMVAHIVDGVGNVINGTLTGLTNTAQSLPDLPIGLGSPLVANNGSLFQYVANIFTPRYKLNGSYQVFLFNGQPKTSAIGDWIVQDNLIGVMGVLSKPDMTDNDLIASGSIPLTRTLQDLTKNDTAPAVLENLSEDIVVPYLAKNLVWKVAGPAGEVDPGTIDGFVLSVYASTAPQVANDQLPFWSDFIPLLDATQNQSGGANSTEQLQAPQQSADDVVPSYSS